MALSRPVALAGLLVALAGAHAESNVSIPTWEIAPGVQMPVISIGTGGLETSAALTITSSWLSLGGRGIDTAYMYKDQTAVKEAITKSGIPRSELFITTKIPGCVNATQYVEADLQQLGMDYVDLMLIHFPGSAADCSATWAQLEAYHAKGTLKAIGVSNFVTSDLDSLLKTAKVVPAVNQIEHNVLNHDDATIAFCTAHKITVEAFSPLGRSGHSGDIPGNKVIQAIAAAHSVSTYQVALRWILQHGITLTFQSSSAAHQASDADVFGFQLTAAEMAQLDALQGPSQIVV